MLIAPAHSVSLLCLKGRVSAPELAPAPGWPLSLPCSAPPPQFESSFFPAQQHSSALTSGARHGVESPKTAVTALVIVMPSSTNNATDVVTTSDLLGTLWDCAAAPALQDAACFAGSASKGLITFVISAMLLPVAARSVSGHRPYCQDCDLI